MDKGMRYRVRKQTVNQHAYVQSVLDRLRILKNSMTYYEMSQKSGIDSTLLCRYITGRVRPSSSRCRLLEQKLLTDRSFQDKLRERIILKQNGYLDLHNLLCDPEVLRWISGVVSNQFEEVKVDKILTAASSGISLATSIALSMDASIAYATHTKSSGPGSYFESEIQSINPSEIFSLYLPVNWLKKGDRILLVDDVATSGRTMIGLLNIVNSARCEVVGIFVLVSTNDEWKDRIKTMVSERTKLYVMFDLGKEAILKV